MSDIPYHSFISSKPFVVLGPGKRLFYAHKDLLAQCSPVLNNDVNGNMQEQRLETIEIKDVDGDIDDDTVMRFIEYAYSGDYTVPNPDIVQLQTDSKEVQEAFKFVADDEWSIPTKKSKKDKKKKRSVYDEVLEEPKLEAEPCVEEPDADKSQNESISIFREDPAPVLQSIDADRRKLWDAFCAKAVHKWPQPWRPRSGNDEREDYTGIFLCHARLYKFADRYDCAKLMSLALQKLQLTLSKYTLHYERVSDIVELIRYAYTHTIDSEQGRDRLRALVLDYVVCYFPVMTQHSSFHKLLQEGGALPSELMIRVSGLIP